MDHLGSTSSSGMPPGLSFEQKWQFLKPAIERLYVHHKQKLLDVMQFLKDQHGFDATEAQYKYQIKKWHLRKNIPTSKKAAMNQKYQQLSTAGMSAVIKYKGQEVDARKLRRQAKTETRRNMIAAQRRETGPDGIAFSSPLVSSSAAKLLMTWNMPYKPSRKFMTQPIDHSSPPGQLALTPSDVAVGTPHANAIASPNTAPSPLSSALRRKILVERARMFLEGDYEQLLASMSHDEQSTMSTWLYQFWLFSFKTAKHWGQGPRDWVSDMLGFGRSEVAIFPILSSHNSPSDSTGYSPSGQPSSPIELKITSMASTPSLLCRWAIHVSQPSYDRLPDPPLLENRALDAANPETYQQWPQEWEVPSCSQRLRNALESNDFSNIPTDRLPAAIPEVLQAAERDPRDLASESLGFAIMSRNEEMVFELLQQAWREGINESILSGIDVLHLATSYLDGSKTCCQIVNTICVSIPIRQHYKNQLGHTVLDNLMIAIIQSHSSCAPEEVDQAFKGQKRFSGEEIDICGRWDADSDCIRELLAKGIHHIPFQWKHEFCHTSIQAICHSITTLWGSESSLDINTCSGIFVRHCLQPDCGVKMQMSPVHTLILVMFQLSSRGCEEEDLFGAVAVLLCLLSYGADPKLRFTLAVTSLIGANPTDSSDREPDGCQHEELDPLQLADAIYSLKQVEWTEKVRLGWQICCEILRYSQDMRVPRQSPEPQPPREKGGKTLICCACKDGRPNYLGKDGRLGLLWSAINAELVTYRRLDLDEPWISDNIDLEAMLEGLQKQCQPNLPLVRDKMMKPSCRCGSFLGRPYGDCLGPHSACAFYFSNMEDWSRTKLLDFPVWWDDEKGENYFTSENYEEGFDDTDDEDDGEGDDEGDDEGFTDTDGEDDGEDDGEGDDENLPHEIPNDDQEMQDVENSAITERVPHDDDAYVGEETFQPQQTFQPHEIFQPHETFLPEDLPDHMNWRW